MNDYVDIHCHGGGGFDFASCTRAEVAMATQVHVEHGTSTMLASLVSMPAPGLLKRVTMLAEAVTDPTNPLVGIHLEGPFLAEGRRGAHSPAALIAPDVELFHSLHEAAAGTLRMITVAPELPGALDVIDAAVSRSVVAAVGHTDATYAQTRAAFDRGASVATHLFNAMRPLGHREPGPVQAALDSAGVWCELIVDGVHLHPAIVAAVFRACPERVVLVTDAMAATGAGDGHYRLGELDVTVEGGCARLADGTIAGSTLTMDVAVARTIAAGVDSALAQAAATSHPATVIGREPIPRKNAVSDLDLGWMTDAIHP